LLADEFDILRTKKLVIAELRKQNHWKSSKHNFNLVSDNRYRKPFKMPDHLGGDMRKVKVDEKEKEEKEIKGNLDFV
jgi:hypothetical protein